MTVQKAGWIAAGVILMGAAAVAVTRLSSGELIALPRGAEAIAAIVAMGTVGWIGFSGLQILVSVSGILPASALGIAAGSIYGVGVGFSVSAVSSLAGAGLAFGLSRSVFRPWIERRMRNRQRLRQVDAAIRRDGWRLACLLRLSPIMPFAPTSYMLGLSSISFRDYCIGTLGSLPALFGYVMIGALAGAGAHASSSGASLIRLVVLGVGLLATAVVTLRIGKLVATVIRWQAPKPDTAEAGADTASRSVSFS
jgi:uncharacterized membrane protein YdjX (TVP38/TMEM64 family)